LGAAFTVMSTRKRTASSLAGFDAGSALASNSDGWTIDSPDGEWRATRSTSPRLRRRRPTTSGYWVAGDGCT
jgi:hypothetical protein